LAGTGPEEELLRDLIARQGVAHRVKLMGFVDERELIKYYSNALAVYFGPFGEDYGYVTLEAFYAKKPVLTLTDSGAPLEFVRDGINGMVLPPDPAAIARAVDSLFERKQLAEAMGRRGWQTIQELRLGWDKVVDKLVS
jgi:glycosyltransferase involved in cell wall biosynthesis